MFPFQPAERAQLLKRHPMLDVGMRNNWAASSPGARHADTHLYHNFEASNDRAGLSLLTTGIPVQTSYTTTLPASNIGGTPTPTTVVLVSTSTVTITVPEESIPTLPAVAIPADSSPSTSLQPPPSSTPTNAPSTATQDTTNTVVSGSDTIPSMAENSSPSPTNPVLAGSAGGSKKSGVSGGAIAAVVVLTVLALCALAFFILRNRRIQKRIARRVTWTAGLAQSTNFDSLEKGASHVRSISSNVPTVAAGQSPMSQGSAPGKTLSPVLNISRKPPLPYSPVSPTPPPQSYNNPPHVAVPYVHPTTSASVPTPNVPMLVRVTFVPQLPDELAITPGETLYIHTEFDDGWALCVNVRGKQGMVPLECLEGGDGELSVPSHVGDWRTSRRASSLRSVATWT
jgi:hypothetical protein